MTGRRRGSGDLPPRDGLTSGHERAAHPTAGSLAAYADEELESGLALEVERHVVGCTACRVSLQVQRAVRDRLGQEAAPGVPAALRDRVFAAVRATPPSAARGARPARPWRRPESRSKALAQRPLLAAAVVLAVVLLGRWGAGAWLGREAAPTVAGGPGGERTDSLEIVDLIQNHATAWNRRDPDAAAALMTADAVWVTSAGVELRGREAIREAHTQWLAQDSAAGGTTHVHPPGGITVRFLREDVAVADLEGQFIGRRIAGEPPVVVEEARIFVVATRDGGAWRIAQLRNLRRQGIGASPR